LQVDKAFAYLEANRDAKDHDLRFEVTNRSQGGRGIYLREPFNTGQPVASTIAIAPVFHEDADNAGKVAFEMRINLECDASWVGHPRHMVLMHGGRSFGVEVNPQSLISGMHYAEVVGHDADHPERGAVFRVPITVLKPETVDTGKPVQWTEALTLAPGQIERRFLVVPPGATWADVVFRTGEQAGSRRIVMQVVQQVPGQSFSESGTRQYITIRERDTEIRSFAVTGGRTLEVAIAQYWSSLGKTGCTVDIVFHGIVPDSRRLHIDAAKLVSQVDVAAPLGNEALSPSGSFCTLRKSIRPSEFKTRPLTDARDALPDNRRIFEAELTYKFNLSAKTTVTPRPALALEDQFQESWESLIWMLYDKSKRLIAAGSSGSKSSVSLAKGDYVLKFHARNHQLDHLKKLKDMPLNLDHKLAKPVALKFHTDPDNALTGGGSFGSRTLARGNQARLYIAQPKPLPGTAAPGDLLLGSIHYGQGNSNLIDPGKKPGGYPVTLRVALAKADKKKTGADKKRDKKNQFFWLIQK